MVVCQTETEYKEMYDCKVKAESSVAPYISLIGSVLEPQYFMVDFENITYKLFKFSKALDICFKSYFVFNIVHPEACDSMWSFVNKQFYGMENGTNEAKPGTHSLVHEIQCKLTLFSKKIICRAKPVLMCVVKCVLSVEKAKLQSAKEVSSESTEKGSS